MTAKILVVDDEVQIRQVLTEMLEKAGYATASAPDGQAALDRLERESFDLVLLDVWMPRMDGLQFLAELRTRWVVPKVIVMTADSTPETVIRAVREQAYQFLLKPVRSDDLLHLIQDVLEAPAAAAVEVVSASPTWLELLVPCQMGAADRMQNFLDKLDVNLAPETRRAVGTAFRELLLNAIEWGGQLDPTRRVRIAYLRFKRMLVYRIADPGAGFRMEDLKHAAIHNTEDPFAHVEVREQKGLRPGGFGILMATSMVDEVLYNEHRNEVVLVKYLDSPPNDRTPPGK
jgi:DNA-binding response OmpR family regulator